MYNFVESADACIKGSLKKTAFRAYIGRILMSPLHRGKLCPLLGVYLPPRGGRSSVCPSILLKNREFSPLRKNEGVNLLPWESNSPLEIKFTPEAGGPTSPGVKLLLLITGPWKNSRLANVGA
jgi:hypothetical protein